MIWRCGECGSGNVFAPMTRADGALEISYLKCDGCGAEVIASVTDAELRKSVAHYAAIADGIRHGKTSERIIRRAERLKDKNVQRSRALREAYITRRREG